MGNDSGGRTIGHNELGEIRSCDCGGVNLAMGPMTLHFSTEEFQALSDLVTAAREALGEDSAKGRSRRTKGGKRKSKAHGTLH